MLKFIETTTRVLKNKLPENTPIIGVDYSCRHGVLNLHFCFYDATFTKKAFDYMYYDVPGVKPKEDIIFYELGSFLESEVLPLL